MELKDLNILKKIIWLRLAQVLVNERYKNGDFVIPKLETITYALTKNSDYFS